MLEELHQSVVRELIQALGKSRRWFYNEPMPLEGWLTVKEAAERLGKTEQAVRDLIRFGRLKARKVSGVNFIHEDELAKFRPGKPGRPRKNPLDSK